ncbi:MAG: PKD domain-containing protein [Bacteroidales bacterium]|nr:PKD domain-containing protein [Bacteroidales bacterium]MDZ4203387.1 PKD domain-containing protein [Bacteroidales bacterium]
MPLRLPLKLFLAQIILLWVLQGVAQINSGGTSPGFADKSRDFALITLTIPPLEIDQLVSEDEAAARNGIAYRIGILLPVNVRVDDLPTWELLPGNIQQWRLRVKTPGALATAIYFSDFYLPRGYRLYLYNDDRSRLLGGFTHENNHTDGLFATGLIPGESVIVECVSPVGITERPRFIISEVLHAYRGVDLNSPKKKPDINGSGACNVNVNCSEGSAWKDQKKGVVRIMTRIGVTAFWCSGSLVNNTLGDYKPYLLTADHCLRNNQGTYASVANLNQWVFYFNYESETCLDPAINPPEKSMTGAILKANTGEGNDNMGSDFSLLLLNQHIPTEYQPYYNGWSRVNAPAQSGVSIHHPAGEIKKISTYTTPLISSYFNNINQQNMYWKVQWAATANGHGVTEGGSSGAPIFNNEGLLVGQLTGGQASCTYPLSPDYYGKFSYSWESFGTIPSKQLKPWLDPMNSGLTQLRGSYNTIQVVANFMADTTVISVGSTITFIDYSTNNPIEWSWRFPGGTPISSTERNPLAIKYSAIGEFDVQLAVKNQLSADTLLRKKYIRVAPALYPNPAREAVNLLLGSHKENFLQWELHNTHGQVMEHGEVEISELYKAGIEFSRRYDGIFLLSVWIGDNRPHHYKLGLLK